MAHLPLRLGRNGAGRTAGGKHSVWPQRACLGFHFGGEEALCLGPVAFALALLLIGILHDYLFVGQPLAVHALDGQIRGLEAVVGDEAEVLRDAGLRVAHDARCGDDTAKSGESVVEELFVYALVKVTYG